MHHDQWWEQGLGYKAKTKAKDLTFKAKAMAKDPSFKAKTKDLTFKAKAKDFTFKTKAKDLTFKAKLWSYARGSSGYCLLYVTIFEDLFIYLKK